MIDDVRGQLEAVHLARETGLSACRRSIRAAGSAIRAVHRHQPERVEAHLADCEAAVREAQSALEPYPSVAHAGFLQDAEKEFVEARLTRALVAGDELLGPQALGVGVPAWLNGLCEAASELRRQILDQLRHGHLGSAEALFASMEDVYDLLVGVDYPDAITGSLRRHADALRAVLERTRSDLTTTVLQAGLRSALDARAAEDHAEG